MENEDTYYSIMKDIKSRKYLICGFVIDLPEAVIILKALNQEEYYLNNVPHNQEIYNYIYQSAPKISVMELFKTYNLSIILEIMKYFKLLIIIDKKNGINY